MLWVRVESEGSRDGRTKLGAVSDRNSCGRVGCASDIRVSVTVDFVDCFWWWKGLQAA